MPVRAHLDPSDTLSSTAFDGCKGYKGNLQQLPKDIRKIVKDKFDGRIENDIILEVDVYYSVDVRNYYKK